MFLAAAAALPAGAAEPRAGTVEFSNGESLRGRLSLPPGSDLRISVENGGLMALGLDSVLEIRLVPVKEEMERPWRFEEAGRTRKTFFGEPAPLRHLRADLLLTGGRTISGHLYAIPLYIETEETTRKVILRARQRGNAGEGFADLVYPSSILFESGASEDARPIRILVPALRDVRDGAVSALTRPALARLDAGPGSRAGEFALPPPLGAGLFFAARSGSEIRVGWPEPAPERIVARIRESLDAVKDFFDGRELLGVARQDEKSDIYSLMMLRRVGGTTLRAERSQPWRVEVWRWKENADGGLMLAGRGVFFRGIAARTPEHGRDVSDLQGVPRVAVFAWPWDRRVEDGMTLDIAN